VSQKAYVRAGSKGGKSLKFDRKQKARNAAQCDVCMLLSQSLLWRGKESIRISERDDWLLSFQTKRKYGNFDNMCEETKRNVSCLKEMLDTADRF